MGFGEQYGALLTAIADEADAMAMRAFRADDLQVERKRDGTALTQADGAIEAMARAKVAASRSCSRRLRGGNGDGFCKVFRGPSLVYSCY